MRESPHPRIELEIAAVRATRRPVPAALAAVLRRVDEALARVGGAAPAASPASQASLLGEEATAGASTAPRTEPVPAAPRAPQPPPRPTFTPPASVPAARPEAAPVPRASSPSAPAGTPTSARAPVPAAPAGDEASAANEPSPGPAGDLATAWQRVVDEVMGKKPMLGTILAQGKPLGVTGGELALQLTASQFQRDLLADRANREIVVQAIRRSIDGADRFTLATDSSGSGSGPAGHPAVRAAIAEFGGEVVAVRPRPREGGSQ
jgi:hypothetical protein